MVDEPPLIGASGLSHSFGTVVALQNLDLNIPPGSTGLVGANGAGKSTLIKILLGIVAPDSGNVTVDGYDVSKDTIAVRSRVGYMPESPCLPLDQSAADFIEYAAELAGLPRNAARQRAADILALVGLQEERFRYFGDFSTGMKQRAMLAQAIVHDPKLVLLDEPTAGLDPDGREQMLDLIGRLVDFGINVLMSSHVLTDIEKTCGWVVMLHEGQILRHGPISGVTHTDTIDVEVWDSADAVVDVLRGRGADVTQKGLVIKVEAREGVHDLIRDALAETKVGVRRLEQTAYTLEDVYLDRDQR